ncbi:MAG: hypothetical protein LIO76_07120 [Clostridiales bacterium]|nr:hypothetical protein [Clostridiales bacterium]
MKSKKRFMALLLAIVLVCSQVGTIGSPVTAEETELTTEAEEITAASDKTDGTAAEGAVSDPVESTTDTTAASDDNTADAADTADASDGATDAAGTTDTSNDTTDAADTTDVSDDTTDTESTGDTAEGTVDDSTEATTGAVSDVEEESEDETDTETIEDANDGISLAGLDLDGSSVDGGDDDEEDDISLTSEDEESDVEVKEVEYWFNYDWIDGTSTTLNGKTIRLYISSVEQRVVYSDGEEEWDEYDEITDFTLDYSSTGRYTDLSIEEAEDGGYYISFTGKRQGGEDTVIISAIDGEEYELTTEYFYVKVAEEYYVLTYNDETIPTEDFHIGDTYTLDNGDFTLTRYYTDGEGQNYSDTVEIDGENYWLRIETDSVDTNALEIKDDGSSAVLRKTNWDTNFWVQVWHDNEDYLNDTRVYVDSYDISTKLTKTYGVKEDPTYYYVFNGHEQTITVSMENGSEFPEDTSIGWNVYIPDEVSSYVTYKVNDDGSITFTVSNEIPDDYREGYNIDFDYYLMYGEDEDSCSGLGGDAIEVLKEYEEYNTAGDEVLVAGEGYDLYSFYAYVRDYNHPTDKAEDIVYSNISIERQYEYNEDREAVSAESDVINLSSDSDSGWYIQALNIGYAELEATYTDLNGDEQTCEFTVYVEDERYYLNWAYLEDQWNILVDEKITIDTSLERVYINENGDPDSYTIEDYTNQGYYLHYDGYDEDILSIKIINGPYEDVQRVLSVTGVSEGGCDIHVFVTDDEDGENIIAEDYIWVYVTSEWYQLTADPENVGLGETVDLSALDYELTRYYTDEDGSNLEETIEIDNKNYRVVMADYEDNCWMVVEGTGDDLLPQLIRIGIWGDSVAVKAQYYDEGDECWYDLWDWCWMYEDISYDSSLTAAYDGVETSNLIVGEAASVTLEEYWKNDYAFPDGYVVYYSVYIEGEEGWKDASDYAICTVKDNVLTLTANSDEYTYVVCATAYYEDIEFSYAELYLSATEETVTYYAESDAWRILKGASTTLHAYQIEYSTEYPEGEVTELQITKVGAMQPLWSDDEDPDLSIFSFDVSDATEDGLEVTGIDEGWRCMYIYATVDGENVRCDNMDEDERYIYIEVTSGYYYLDLEDSYTISLQEEDHTIPLTLSEILHLTYVDEDDGTVDKTVGLGDLSEKAYISFSYSDEDGEEVISYAEDIITASAEDGTITIEGLNGGETELLIAVYDYDEEGEKYEIAEEWIMVYVQGKNDAEITQSDGSEAVTEYTKAVGDEFSLDLDTNSDSDIQYKVIEGTDVVKVDEDGNVTVTGTGTAVIKAWVEESDTYYEAEITIYVGSKYTATIDANDITVTYGLDKVALEATVDSDASLTYEVTDGSDVVSVDGDGIVTVLRAGTAKVTISAAETDKYYAAEDVVVTVTVDKATAKITGTASYEKYTTDSAFTLDSSLNHDETSLTYAVSVNSDVVSVDEKGEVKILKAGTAEITVSAVGTDNYNAAENLVISVTVVKAAASITPATSTQAVTYGQSIVLSTANLGLTVVGDGTPTYTVTSGTDVLSISGTTATTLKAGTAVITVSMAATDTYSAAEPVTITVTVNKADGTGSVTITGWVAGEDANTPTVTSATNGTDSVTFYYKVTGADDSTYTTTVPTTAGSYTVKAVFAATDCYNEVSATCDFTILDLSGYVKYDTNVTSLDDITLPDGWSWASGQEIISGAINYVQAVNDSTRETITVPVALIPHITSNDTFTKNVDTSAVIRCSGDLNYFRQVAVDGTVVATTNYTATSGSTILTFTEDYMNSLSVGEHTVALTYDSGTVSATLTVLTQSSNEETESETDTEAETETETETDTEEATETTTTASGESETTGSDSVSTGDETPIATTLAVMLLAAALLIAGAAYRRMYGRRK